MSGGCKQNIMPNVQDDLATLHKFRRVLSLVSRELEPDMPLGYLRIMIELMVAHLEGGSVRFDLTQKDLRARTQAEQSSLSRAVNALADSRKTKDSPSYHIADNVTDALDRRRKLVRLNPKGIALLNKLLYELEAEQKGA